eukprot:TRINITY_DN3754_c0_g1_i3.p1 TRINITY_DN3754_c0_g1~~TRINITY_DN3754_c0_g1_i3.p1  ORF type:complete len:1005 (-),score=284.90 TRINITY_DN3754_c0_g1_i3:114-3128(-)
MTSTTSNSGAGERRDVITFAINGERYDVKAGEYDVTTSLNSFIRKQASLKGTKLACGQGGCGACAVNLSRLEDGNIVYLSVNSCLRPLGLMDGWSVTTTEGLGDSKRGFHPIQERIAQFNGSQCGFCTPGMVMNLYSALKEKPERSMQELEARMDGNICRCTGFRPILDAIKSFAVDSNTQNLVNKDLPFSHGPYNAHNDPKFPDFLHTVSRTRQIQFTDPHSRTWTRPSTLQEALQLSASSNSSSTKLVFANTSVGYYPEEQKTVKNYIDISNLEELKQHSTDPEKGITVGAGVTITAFIAYLRATEAKNGNNVSKVKHLNALANHAYRVAGTHVRNIASIGGNLIIAKQKGFVSDLATILLGAKATVTYVKNGANNLEYSEQSLEEFLRAPQLENNQILFSITIPWTNDNTYFATYKAAPRPQQAVASINSAFWFDVDRNNGIVQDVVLSFGGVMTEDAPGSHAIRAKRAEDAIKGQNIREKKTIEAAMEALKQDFSSNSGERDQAGGEVKYRERLVSGFLYKNFISVLGAINPNGGDVKIDSRVVSATIDPAVRTEVSHGVQRFKDVEEAKDEKQMGTVGKAIPHLSAKIQAAGEAVYTDDIGELEDTLYVAIVMAREPTKILTAIDKSGALLIPGILGVLDVRDVRGKNNALNSTEVEIFVPIGQEVKYDGQPAALVVAKNEKLARRGADAVKLTYTANNRNAAVVRTIDEALKEGGQRISPVRTESKIGDVDKEDAAELGPGDRRATGTVYIGTQHHFYLEPQTAYVVPDESLCYSVYSPNQWPDAASATVAEFLGVDYNQVRSIQRRSGGAFGGKVTPTNIVACCAALAAQKYKLPARCALDRYEDFKISGGREETKANYNVKFDAQGKIKSLRVDGWLNAGFTEDMSVITNQEFMHGITQSYYIPNVKAESTLVKTDLANRTTMRGPGNTQASFTIEHVMEHIAHELNLPAYEIRERNLLSETNRIGREGKRIESFTLPEVWNKCKETSDVERRRSG